MARRSAPATVAAGPIRGPRAPDTAISSMPGIAAELAQSALRQVIAEDVAGEAHRPRGEIKAATVARSAGTALRPIAAGLAPPAVAAVASRLGRGARRAGPAEAAVAAGRTAEAHGVIIDQIAVRQGDGPAGDVDRAAGAAAARAAEAAVAGALGAKSRAAAEAAGGPRSAVGQVGAEGALGDGQRAAADIDAAAVPGARRARRAAGAAALGMDADGRGPGGRYRDRIAIATLPALAAGSPLGEVAVDRGVGQIQAAGAEVDGASHRVAAGAAIAARVTDPRRPGHPIHPVRATGLVARQRDLRQRHAAAVDHHRAADRREPARPSPPSSVA